MPGLRIEDFRNPLFDRQRIVQRQVHTAPGRKEPAYEGTTFTDNFIEVGFTYIIRTGELSIKSTDNQQLFEGKINSPENFEKALKKADMKCLQLSK